MLKPPDYEARQAIQKEFDRIIKTPGFRASSAEFARLKEVEVRWLLTFCEFDLTEDADWKWFGKRLHRFAIRLVGCGGVWPSSVYAARETGEGGLALVPGWGAVPTELPPVPVESEIRALHAQLREILNAFWPSNGELPRYAVRIPARIQHVHLTHDGKRIKRSYGSDWPDWLWLAIAAALEEFGSHIERCQAPDCGRRFVRIRRQAYCSAECSQRVRSRRWYKAHQEEARKQRRKAYENEVRRKSYAKAKIQSRKRSAK